LICGSATLIHAGMDLMRAGMGTIRGHVGWNCSGVTDDRACIRASVARRPSAVCRLSSYVLLLTPDT
jgi:hypothetical protein